MQYQRKTFLNSMLYNARAEVSLSDITKTFDGFPGT